MYERGEKWVSCILWRYKLSENVPLSWASKYLLDPIVGVVLRGHPFFRELNPTLFYTGSETNGVATECYPYNCFGILLKPD